MNLCQRNQTVFILSNKVLMSKQKETDHANVIEVKYLSAFYSYPNNIDQQSSAELQILQTFPYLAMTEIPIQDGVPEIHLKYNNPNINLSFEKTFPPKYSTTVCLYISNDTQFPTLELYQALSREMLIKVNAKKNASKSIIMIEKENPKNKRNEKVKSDKTQDEKKKNQNVKIKNELFKKQIQKMDKYAKLFDILSPFILRAHKYSKLSTFIAAAALKLTRKVELNYLHLYSILRINGRVRTIEELIDYATAFFTCLRSDYIQPISKEFSFRGILKATITDVLNDLRKAELHGPYTAILISGMKLTNILIMSDQNSPQEEILIPKSWTFMPITLPYRSDMENTGQYAQENYGFIETTILNGFPMAAILGYSPHFHTQLKHLIIGLLKSNTQDFFDESLNMAGWKLLDDEKPSTQAFEGFWEIVSLFLKTRKKGAGETGTESTVRNNFPEIYWKTIFKSLPNRAVFPGIIPDLEINDFQSKNDDSQDNSQNDSKNGFRDEVYAPEIVFDEKNNLQVGNDPFLGQIEENLNLILKEHMSEKNTHLVHKRMYQKYLAMAFHKQTEVDFLIDNSQ
ncbi:hypothetical protein TRFO_29421 [Tritrichomonas foetus]|uniref:Uncharacterized protein n=1 Tax=Tritrichomonas foetus TaxID=1144522 RepID=A0A1J4JX38_9EUKA|nr:hypothetical protein TRFO_29421 [Tritrichomonas foetus]|eukprot:OHT03234.1 hypothetical protein TRFO_29421 [Tritrichomonas foetus]